jgi:hypothetical protein
MVRTPSGVCKEQLVLERLAAGLAAGSECRLLDLKKFPDTLFRIVEHLAQLGPAIGFLLGGCLVSIRPPEESITTFIPTVARESSS